jgi:opacity protein-like surface antigen
MKKNFLSTSLLFGSVFSSTSFADISVRGNLGFSTREGIQEDARSNTFVGLGLDYDLNDKIVVGLQYTGRGRDQSGVNQAFFEDDRLYLGADYWVKNYFSVGATAGVAWENWGELTIEHSKNVYTWGARARFELPLGSNSYVGSETDFVHFLNSSFSGVSFSNSAYVRLKF